MPRSTTNPQQRPVTAIPASAAYAAAMIVPAVTVVVVGFAGRRGAELAILAVALFLGLMAVAALLSYVLATGQFPPRVGRASAELPAGDVEDTGRSLQLTSESIRELAERVERLERRDGDDLGEGGRSGT